MTQDFFERLILGLSTMTVVSFSIEVHCYDNLILNA